MENNNNGVMSTGSGWVFEYTEEVKKLKKIVPSKFCCCFMHVGSTAAHSITARPIIDIAIGVINSLDLITVKDILVFNGYKFLDTRSNINDLLLEKKLEGKSSFFIHVLALNGKKWNEMFQFTEILRTNQKAAKEYSAFKADLLINKKVSPVEYERLKAEYIQKLLETVK